MNPSQHEAASVALVGDGIENPANIRLLQSVAQGLGADCLLRLAAPTVAQLHTDGDLDAPRFQIIDAATGLLPAYARRIALETLPKAKDVYSYRAGPRFALMVGNERRGLTRSFLDAATDAVAIPMHSARLSSLNVAAAAAVGLYYMMRAPAAPLRAHGNPQSRRPALLLSGVREHYELGSAIRSAAAFGWQQTYVEDTEGVWFGVDRSRHAEGRAAARRARNRIRLLPCAPTTHYDVDEAIVVTASEGPPLSKLNLARGHRQLLALPAHDNAHLQAETWQRIGAKVSLASLQLPPSARSWAYRLYATIAMAECARQVGRAGPESHQRRGQRYTFAPAAQTLGAGESVTIDELTDY